MSETGARTKARGLRPQPLAGAARIAGRPPWPGLTVIRRQPRHRWIFLAGALLFRVHLYDIKWPSARSFSIQLLFT